MRSGTSGSSLTRSAWTRSAPSPAGSRSTSWTSTENSASTTRATKPAARSADAPGPRQRQNVSTSHDQARPGGVVSIGRHSGYRPDFKGLASGQVRAAREQLGFSLPEFADYLGHLLGWAVTAESVER